MFDGTYTDSELLYSKALTAIQAHPISSTDTLTDEELKKNLIREMRVVIEKPAGATYATVKLTNTIHPYWTSKYSMSTKFQETTMIYDGNAQNQNPRDIYIYYIPNYASKAGHYNDQIWVFNNDRIPVNVHLMRIEDPEIINNAER